MPLTPAGSGAAARPNTARRGGRSSAAWLLFALILSTGALRLLTLPMIDAGGDALLKWHQSKVALGLVPGQWEWSHHTARVGILLPTMFVQACFGTAPWLYYLPALTASLVQTGLVFALGCRLHGRLLGVCSALLILFFPPMRMSGAQLLPGVFSGTYIAAALLCLVCRRDGDRHGRTLLTLAALAMFAAYTVKLSNLFFIPGLIAAAWLWRKTDRDVVYLAVTTGGLILLETAAYWTLTGHPMGRLGMVQAAHAPMSPLGSPLELFGRYADLPPSWSAALTLFALVTLASAWRPQRDWLAIALAPLTFLLGLTLTVRSFDPLIPAQAFNARYLTALLPCLTLTVCLGIAQSPPGAGRHWQVARATALTLLTLGVLTVTTWRAQPQETRWAAHPLARLERYITSAETFATGTPLISADPRGLGVRAWLALFWEGEPRPVRQLRYGDGGFWVAFAPGHERPVDAFFGEDVLLTETQRLPESDSYSFSLSEVQFLPRTRPRKGP